MTDRDFNELLRLRMAACNKVLRSKAGEYARGDRLHNFKRGAAFNMETPERTLWGMVIKHITSVLDFIEDVEKGVLPSPTAWHDKLGDVVNYMFLLEGLLEDRYGEKMFPPALLAELLEEQSARNKVGPEKVEYILEELESLASAADEPVSSRIRRLIEEIKE